MDNNTNNKDPFGINDIAFDLGKMASFAGGFSGKVKQALEKIKEDKEGQFTPEQKAEIDKIISESDIDKNMSELEKKLAELKNLGKPKAQ